MKKLSYLIIALLLCKLQFSQNNMCFSPSASNPVGASLASYICKGDFNGDGITDFLTGWRGAHNFNLSLSTVNNSFSVSVGYSASSRLHHVVSSDFNNDGAIDVALCIGDSNYVKVLLGNGAGSFTAASLCAVGSGPNYAVVKDFNNDGLNDLAVCNGNANSISVLLGNGNGGFSAAVNTTVSSNPHAIVAANFNNDAYPDLAVACANSVSVLMGSATGTYAVSSINLKFSSIGQNVMVATDLNGDGRSDIAGIYNDTLSVVLKNPGTGFSTPTKYALGRKAAALDFADLNNDFQVDLLTANNFERTYSILQGNGSGGFSSITSYSYAVSPIFQFFAPMVITTTDMNSDNKADIVIGHDNANELMILENCNTVNVGMPDFATETKLMNLYPNPANSHLTIELVSGTKHNCSFEIRNVNGKLLKSVEAYNEKISIDLQDFPKGLYLLLIHENGSTLESKRFVVGD